MKSLLQTLTLALAFIPIFSSFSQVLPYTTPATSSSIFLTEMRYANPDPDAPVGDSIDSNMFRISPLVLSDPDASYMHFWWGGDNGFSFAPEPVYNHVVDPGDTSVLKMTGIPTENYGSGGPPPLTYSFTTEHIGSELPKVLGVDSFLHVQTYRNAVKRDTMYLIVTYANSKNFTIDGKVKIDVGSDARILDNVLGQSGHYFPNGERWLANKDEFTFENLKKDEERSVLIPVKIRHTSKDFVTIRVYSYQIIGGEAPPNTGTSSVDFFMVSPAVADSHDPNMMIEESDAKYQCDYRGGNIHYTVKFQNDGPGRTNYVRVVCHLDKKLDLKTIDVLKYPKCFDRCIEDTIRRKYENKCGAIWSIDEDAHTLTIEMHDLRLYSSTDPRLPRIDMARGEVEFDISVNGTYEFGDPVVSHAEIFFDENPVIVTNDAETGCLKHEVQSFICLYKWWFAGGLLLLLLIIILIIRRRRKKRRERREAAKQ